MYTYNSFFSFKVPRVRVVFMLEDINSTGDHGDMIIPEMVEMPLQSDVVTQTINGRKMDGSIRRRTASHCRLPSTVNISMCYEPWTGQ
jgi:hypothetical protein